MFATLVPLVLLLLSSQVSEVSARPFIAPRQALDLGSCGSPEIKFGMGFDQRTELSYQPVNLADFSHGSDKTINNIAGFICNRLASPCGAPQATLDQCALSQGHAQKRTGGAAADTFNNGMGIVTGYAAVADNNFGTPDPAPEPTTPTAVQSQTRNTPTTPAPPPTPSAPLPPSSSQQRVDPTSQDNPAQSSTTSNRPGDASTTSTAQPASRTTGITPAATNIALQEEVMSQCKLVAMIVTYTLPADQVVGGLPETTPENRKSDMAFGSCTDPTIMFGAGLDGRRSNEFVFINNNIKEFNHKSDVDPAVIMQSTCEKLVSQCGLRSDDRAVVICRAAIGPASAFGKHGAAADSFNGALGFRTDYQSVIIPN